MPALPARSATPLQTPKRTLIPIPVIKKGRLYWLRADVERYKRELAGLPPVNDPSASFVLEFVPALQFCAETGESRRTLGRRIRELIDAYGSDDPAIREVRESALRAFRAGEVSAVRKARTLETSAGE